MAHKILVVDDAMFMRTMIKNLLKNSTEFEIIGEAENGLEAIQKFKELQPDIVTLDITMPEMDGLEALKEIIKIDANARVVICSAMGQQSMVLDAIKLGAKDFIVKPFQADRVIEALTKVVTS
ncbi:two-component system response regulator [Bacillus pseudomycoides]|uniref:Two-component system response regulator n=1 Tax=Bacillus pseudomycoides TaxID=64104 RepID=A0AA91ZUP2_9BACI|nr:MULTISPECIES: response regulator [Bacillus]PEB53959.1 two-component system response regulator [Bacillus sp. AFS098217]PED82928.1 two-component system response regulator [Bacillus pseudomycoides]PEU07449.1 two-component system response regulator [Bacillus sp. AFS019443]PEU17413.1 two-component system response regulator [Bacillus sp. AFS014408]PFW62561.1 two-component system response regulator [Bacillus sp. AFS075034]